MNNSFNYSTVQMWKMCENLEISNIIQHNIDPTDNTKYIKKTIKELESDEDKIIKS